MNIEYFTTVKEILFLDGRDYAQEIRDKSAAERNWWENIYLWFHDNFEMIMIVGGCILLALLIFNYLDGPSSCISRNKISKTTQRGGDPPIPGANSNSSSNSGANTSTPNQPASEPKQPASEPKQPASQPASEAKPGETEPKPFVPKSDRVLNAEAKVAAAKKKAENILAGKSAPEKTTNQKLRSKFLLGRAEKNITNAKEAIKGMPGKAFGAVAGKSVAAWQSVKSGEALEKGKEKFEDALSNAGDFAKQHAKAGYALAFTTFMVIGFGLFFVPTLVMFVIGAVTLMIFNKQKMQFFESI